MKRKSLLLGLLGVVVAIGAVLIISGQGWELEGKMLMLSKPLLVAVLVALVSLLVALVSLPRFLMSRYAKRAGHPSLRSYLTATPRTDAEKRDAVELALQGLVLCLLGLLFWPLLLCGLIPFYYGSRKLCIAMLGAELLEE